LEGIADCCSWKAPKRKVNPTAEELVTFMPLLFFQLATPAEAAAAGTEEKVGRKTGERGGLYGRFKVFSLFLRVYTGLLVDGEELSFVFTFGAFPRVWLIIYCKNQIKVGFVFNEWTSS
jgi:hypothetical protein